MIIKEFLKPTFLKIAVFLFMAVIFLYLAKEDVCGAGFFFAFCYKAYGFPLSYVVAGNIDTAFGHIKTLFLGKYFVKYGNLLVNPEALILNIASIYLFACLIDFAIFHSKKKPN